MAKKKEDSENQLANSEMEMNVENTPPAFLFKSFDEFFYNYAKINNINLKWKDAVVLHAKTIGVFNFPEKWEYCCKHFGI